MRVLVCGGRDFFDYDFVKITLNKIHKEKIITVLIHGAARGADSLGALWVEENDINILPFPVTKEDFNKFGKSAPQ